MSGAASERAPGRSFAVLIAALALFGASCGYHLIGQSSSLPPRLKTLFISPLVNQSGRAELDQRLTEEITQEWVRRGRFQLVSSADQADAVLSGTVSSATISPVQFDTQGRATQYQLTVTANMQLVDRTGEKPVVLWRDQSFSRTLSYAVDINATDYFDREVQAMDDLSRDFARGLVVTILEGF
jgi:outer membrane lipopolysaccharide assembly protein LptE/RlpB